MNSVEIMSAKEARELSNNNEIEFLKKYSKSINNAIKRHALLGCRSVDICFFENISDSALSKLKEIGYKYYVTIKYDKIHERSMYTLHISW